MRPILVTGAAGFIGFHVSRRLLADGRPVCGVDDLNPYYDPALKEARLAELLKYDAFRFEKLDLARQDGTEELFAREGFEEVVHLAAQAGVRHSLRAPHAYVRSNLVAFANVLEGCRHANVHHLVFASSSSVYGGSTRTPFSVAHGTDHPLSLYAATKKANEVMAHAYASLFGLPVSGLRFFTVYGPWGRPDMAMFLFTRAILDGTPVDLYNHGKMRRDFTYVDDVVEGVVRVLDRPARPDPAWSSERPHPATSSAPYRVYNVGNHDAIELLELVETLERALGRAAVKRFVDMQPGDVPATFADVQSLAEAVGFSPRTPLREGVDRFVAWYRGYYGV